ncbi:Type II secretion system protein N [Marinomonas aquimarina]|uniref:Type II secretion system protein N n=1 Tax=Marinomonas aquimarina TaxID=295068 RepID=A0A1A8TG40_9GAMM|nr:type II secretion system protein N [Marinomonas aquimarina]SBS32397.1 Type II secretion system protein N [Marinomonas aquimarina]
MHWKAFEKFALLATEVTAVTVLAVALGSVSAKLWFSSEVVPQPFVMPDQTPQTAVIDTLSNDLFGSSSLSEPIKETALRLTLLGVMPSQNPRQGMAVIRSAANNEKTYQVGDSPIAGVRLNAVYNDHVVLQRADQLESLFFGSANERTAAPLFLPSAPSAEAPVSASMAVPTTAPETQTWQTDRATVPSNPQQVLQDAGVSHVDGHYQLNQDSPLTQLGLQPGDRIISVNGLSLERIQSEPSLQEQLQQSGSLRAEIERGEKRLMINFSLQ